MARRPCIAIGLLPLVLRLSPRNATGSHPSHPIDPVDFRLMSAMHRLAPVPHAHPGLPTHVASLNCYSGRTFWIHPAAVCLLPEDPADPTVLPAPAYRRLAPVNTICQQPRGQKPDLHLRSSQKFPRFTYRTSFHLCTSTPVAGSFWCRPSSPMAGTPYVPFSASCGPGLKSPWAIFTARHYWWPRMLLPASISACAETGFR